VSSHQRIHVENFAIGGAAAVKWHAVPGRNSLLDISTQRGRRGSCGRLRSARRWGWLGSRFRPWSEHGRRGACYGAPACTSYGSKRPKQQGRKPSGSDMRYRSAKRSITHLAHHTTQAKPRIRSKLNRRMILSICCKLNPLQSSGRCEFRVRTEFRLL
jgi:hypothetical protein